VGIVVGLTPVDERLLTPLLSVAVAETKPDEVMPPVEAPPGWSQPRQDAFCEFYRSHYRGLNGPTRTLIYGILCNSDVVGVIRMARSNGPDTLETGMFSGGHGLTLAGKRFVAFVAKDPTQVGDGNVHLGKDRPRVGRGGGSADGGRRFRRGASVQPIDHTKVLGCLPN